MIRVTADDASGAVSVVAEEELLGKWRLVAGLDPAGQPPSALFCENESNVQRLYESAAAQMPYPKDDINDHVIHGAWGLAVIG